MGERVPRLHEQRRRRAGARRGHGRDGSRRRALHGRPRARARRSPRTPRAAATCRPAASTGSSGTAPARRSRPTVETLVPAEDGTFPAPRPGADRPPRPARRRRTTGRTRGTQRLEVVPLTAAEEYELVLLDLLLPERRRAAHERLARRQRRRRRAVRAPTRSRAAAGRGTRAPLVAVRCEARYHGPAGARRAAADRRRARRGDRARDCRRRRARPRPAAVPRRHRPGRRRARRRRACSPTATCSRALRADGSDVVGVPPPTAPRGGGRGADRGPESRRPGGDHRGARRRPARPRRPLRRLPRGEPSVRGLAVHAARAGRTHVLGQPAHFSLRRQAPRATSCGCAGSTRPGTARQARRRARSSSACRRWRRSRRRSLRRALDDDAGSGRSVELTTTRAGRARRRTCSPGSRRPTRAARRWRRSAAGATCRASASGCAPPTARA